ncbi:hypothetical protein HJ588_10265 [Flexivirga sp. ID2601S]|uniref:Uncharacterized protein n=1 Tax=Flexivirga aerilata TaxID=1656889 RepID=A0A849AFP4_9MICO|nr:hypothetical protein [Flexivirga aerilata]NNG39654.1 hypothetical protein [Flexivirga aerilata]
MTLTAPDDYAYNLTASIVNMLGAGGGAIPDGLRTYAESGVANVKPGGTVTVRLSWPASIKESYLYADAGVDWAVGGDNKNIKLGGANGLHGYSTICGAASKPTGTTQPTAPQPTDEPPTPSPVTTQIGVTG